MGRLDTRVEVNCANESGGRDAGLGRRGRWWRGWCREGRRGGGRCLRGVEGAYGVSFPLRG